MELKMKHIPKGHSFVRNGKELNVGDTLTVSKERGSELIERGVAEEVKQKTEKNSDKKGE